MTDSVVVLGSGYAGTGSVMRLEETLSDADLTWISDVDHHLVLHESHRCISNPAVQEKVAIPIEEVKAPTTDFVHASVTDIDTAAREVELADHEPVSYDYLLVGLGSTTAFFGIHGLEENAHTLKSLADALGIHEALTRAGRAASATDPAQVLVGGAGLSGIQTAGEIAALRDEKSLPIDITLIEGLDSILPGADASLQGALRDLLEARDVTIRTGEFVGEVDDDTVYVGESSQLAYDVLVWTGGVAGRDAVREAGIETDERSHRIEASTTFRTSEERVFAIGDAALVDQADDEPAPPTAQAAWQAAEVAGTNVARATRGQPLEEWTYDDKGTVVSVGEDAVAHDVSIVPFVSTFGGFPARFLKKAIAARWLKDVGGYRRAISAWSEM
jgi:NADH dehydrogenase